MATLDGGLNLTKNLLVGDTTETIFQGGVGIGTDAFNGTQTSLLGGGTDIDDFDSVSGWSTDGDADSMASNTTSGERQEGDGCANIPLTFSTGTAGWSKTITSTDLSSKSFMNSRLKYFTNIFN